MSANELSLVRTKLAPPRIGSAPIRREALLAQLEARANRKLSLLIGPAGCGKTMLLTQWRKHLFVRNVAVAWYNAGSDDDDLHIAAYIVEALRQSGVDIASESLQVYTRSAGKAWRPLLADLVNDVADHGADVYLVIDDFQHICSYAMLQLIDRWLAVAPANFHLVLGSRARPPLDLSQLRAQDQVTELTFAELRFSQDETRRFMDAQGVPEIGAAQIALLHEGTDGWAAGLQLLAFSLRKQKQPELVLEQLARLSLAQEDSLNTYLERVATEHLSDAEFAFLIRICACRRFNRELCELLTGDPGAAGYLAKFETESLFLIPIDTTDRDPWYRFHRLFAAFLARHLAKLDPAEVRKLHQLASHWFAGKNLHVEALRHANLAGDNEFVVELIDRAARRMINGAHFIELLKWCATVPRDHLHARLNVCLCAAWAQLSCSRLADFERTMAYIAQHPGAERTEVRIEVQLLKAYRCLREDDTAEQLRIVGPMMTEAMPANPFHRLLLCSLAALGSLYTNRFEDAREIARRYAPARLEHDDVPRPFLDSIHGISHLLQGHVRTAAGSLQSMVETTQRATMLGADATGITIGYLIEARYQHDELDAARELIDQHMDLIDAVAATDSLLYSYRVRAHIQRSDGDLDGALRTLQKLEETGYRRGIDRLIAWSLYEQIGLAVREQQRSHTQDLLTRLQQLAQRYRNRLDGAWGEIALAASLAQAEVAAESAAPAAIELLDAAEQACRLRGRGLLAARMGFLRASLLFATGDRDAALRSGAELVSLVREIGMQRVLMDLGQRVTPLIAALLDGRCADQDRAYLLGALHRATPNSNDGITDAGNASPNGRGERLSARELEVIELLGKALSTKSIARALNLSAGTVKWHLKNVYGKLNAISREDALAKARSLNLIA